MYQKGCSTLARTLALIFFSFQFIGIQLPRGARSFGNEPRDVFAVFMFSPLLNAKVFGIAENSLLFTVQQFVGGHDGVDVGSGGIDAVYQAQLVINTNVLLHAKVPFVPLFGLMHLRIALASTVLGGAGSRDNGGIYDAAFTQQSALKRRGIEADQQQVHDMKEQAATVLAT